MKHSMVAAAGAALFIATPVVAQEPRPIAVEGGVVMGVIAVPYATVAVVRAPWAVRISGGGERDCHGAQLNVGRVVRDEGNAKHTIGAMWAGFRNDCSYRARIAGRNGGQYAGAVYDFQAKGFFLEVGSAFGARNPFWAGFDAGPLTRIYGQIGYVHRFGKRYDEPEEDDDGGR